MCTVCIAGSKINVHQIPPEKQVEKISICIPIKASLFHMHNIFIQKQSTQRPFSTSHAFSCATLLLSYCPHSHGQPALTFGSMKVSSQTAERMHAPFLPAAGRGWVDSGSTVWPPRSKSCSGPLQGWCCSQRDGHSGCTHCRGNGSSASCTENSPSSQQALP